MKIALLSAVTFASIGVLVAIPACDNTQHRYLEEKPDNTVMTIPADFARSQGMLQCDFDADIYVLPDGRIHGDNNQDGKLEGDECK